MQSIESCRLQLTLLARCMYATEDSITGGLRGMFASFRLMQREILRSSTAAKEGA